MAAAWRQIRAGARGPSLDLKRPHVVDVRKRQLRHEARGADGGHRVEPLHQLRVERGALREVAVARRRQREAHRQPRVHVEAGIRGGDQAAGAAAGAASRLFVQRDADARTTTSRSGSPRPVRFWFEVKNAAASANTSAAARRSK